MMADGNAVTGSAFGPEFAAPDEGTPADDWSDEALFGSASDDTAAETQPPATTEQPATQAPAPQQQPSTPQETQGQEQQQPGQQAPAEGEATPDEAQLAEQAQEPGVPHIRRKYGDDWVKADRGYRNLQRLHSRTREQLQRAELERQQLAAFVEQARPYLERVQQAAQAQAQGLPLSEEQQLDLSQLDPQQLQAVINQQVQAQVGRVQQETQAQQFERAIAETVQSFMAQHPEIEPEGELDMAIGELLEEFQTDPDGHRDLQNFPITHENLELTRELAMDEAVKDVFLELDLTPTRENLEIAKQAVADPAFGEVLLANPSFVDSPTGLEYARKLAQMPGMYSQAAATAQQQLSPELARRAAHVETGGTGAPVQTAPGAVPQDEFDEAIAAYQGGRGDNIFGLQVQE